MVNDKISKNNQIKQESKAMKEHAICTRSNSFYLQLVSVTTSTRDKEKCKGRKFSPYQVTSLQGSWNVMRDIAATVTRPTENLIQKE